MKGYDEQRRVLLKGLFVIGKATSFNGYLSKPAYAAIPPHAIKAMISGTQMLMGLIAQANNPSGLVSQAQLNLLFSIQKQLTEINGSLETILTVLDEIYKEIGRVPSRTVEKSLLNEIRGESDTLLENRIAFYDPVNENYKPAEFIAFVHDWLGKTVILRNRIIAKNLEPDTAFSSIAHICKLQFLESSAWLEMMSEHAEQVNSIADFTEFGAALKSYIRFYDAALSIDSQYSLASVHKNITDEYKDNLQKHEFVYSLVKSKQKALILGCEYDEEIYDNPDFGINEDIYGIGYYNPDIDIEEYIELYVNLTKIEIEYSYLGVDAHSIDRYVTTQLDQHYLADISRPSTVDSGYEKPLPSFCNGVSKPAEINEMRSKIRSAMAVNEKLNIDSHLYAASKSAYELADFSRERAICLLKSIETGSFGCL